MKSIGMKKRMAIMLILLAGGHMTARPGVIITGLLDGTLAGGCPKVIELFVTGTENLSDYEVWRSLNGAPFGSGTGSISTMSGIYSNTFVYLVKTDHVSAFHDVFGSEGIYAHVVPMGIINGNGNDGFQVRLKAGSVIIDQVWYENAEYSYEDSYWYRKNGTGPDGGWLSSAWETPGNGALDGLDQEGLQAMVPFGTYAMIWQGLTSDWNSAGNWSLGIVPSFQTNVVIPDSVDSFPVIENLPESPAVCMDLTILDTARIIVQAGNALTVHGNLTITASPGDQETGLILETDSAIDLSGSVILRKNVIGSMTIKRHIDKDNSWHYLSSPVLGQYFQPGFVPDTVDSSYDLYFWSENSDLSTAWINSRDVTGAWNPAFEDVFIPGKGYLLSYSAANTGDLTRTFSGQPVTGDAYISIYHSGNYWNLLGNPYTCSLDWSSNGISKEYIAGNAMYIWDPALNNNQGGYRTHNGAIGVPEGTAPIIPALQGFFVQSLDEGVLAVYPGLDEPLVHGSQPFYKNENLLAENRIRLKVSKGTLEDETILCFIDSASNAYDPRYDAAKMFNGHPGCPELFTMADPDHPLCINSLAQVPASVPLGISYTGEDTLMITAFDFAEMDPETGIFLEDRHLASWTDLRLQPDYKFRYEPDPGTRFMLHIMNVSGEDNDNGLEKPALWASGKRVYIVNPYERPGFLHISSIEGKCLQSLSVPAGESAHEVQVPAGLYIARLITGPAIIAEKVFIY
jgi:hypothetical protein